MNTEDLYEDDIVKIIRRKSRTASDTVIVTFAGIQFKLGWQEGEDEFNETPEPEFVSVGIDSCDQIHIIDKYRCWGNLIDWEWLGCFLTDVCEGKRVISLGNCVSGHTACLLPYYMYVDKVIAFTPHYSPSNKFVPDRYRYPAAVPLHDLAMKYLKHEHIEPYLIDNTEYFCFWTEDSHILDVKHKEHFLNLKQWDNVHNYILNTDDAPMKRKGETLKNIPMMLFQKGILHTILRTVMDNENPQIKVFDILREHGIYNELS